jgi:hypothetical protein
MDGIRNCAMGHSDDRRCHGRASSLLPPEYVCILTQPFRQFSVWAEEFAAQVYGIWSRGNQRVSSEQTSESRESSECGRSVDLYWTDSGNGWMADLVNTLMKFRISHNHDISDRLNNYQLLDNKVVDFDSKGVLWCCAKDLTYFLYCLVFLSLIHFCLFLLLFQFQHFLLCLRLFYPSSSFSFFFFYFLPFYFLLLLCSSSFTFFLSFFVFVYLFLLRSLSLILFLS